MEWKDGKLSNLHLGPVHSRPRQRRRAWREQARAEAAAIGDTAVHGDCQVDAAIQAYVLSPSTADQAVQAGGPSPPTSSYVTVCSCTTLVYLASQGGYVKPNILA